MKSIDELGYYELLEIPRAASQNEIDRAYRLAQETYADGSLALYSVFENIDAEAIRGKLDDAYRILSDPETRESYNQEIAAESTIEGEGLAFRGDAAAYGHDFHEGRDFREGHDFREGRDFPEGRDALEGRAAAEGGWGEGRGNEGAGAEPVHGYDASGTPTDSDRAGAVGARLDGAGDVGNRLADQYEEYVEESEFDAFDDPGNGDFDGVRLRKTRLFRGYEIEDISDVTKVSGAHLRNIEEENFHDLPADVYVRGFVTAYAKTIGLDPSVVVPAYMARVAEFRDSTQPGRFMGRR